jgi:2-amino-4-hydroxy-6-hydroxymethyldihydropteridine diphosphokinase
LGSNLGNKRLNLARACRLLEEYGVKVRRASSLYRTQPVGCAKQPWFYNQVVAIETPLSPFKLLTAAKDIERRLKREPAVRNGPRRIDVDILLAGKTVLLTRRLVIPHPRLARRRFVLKPLREIAPAVVHPILHESIAALEERCRDTSIVAKVRTRARPS